jgi:cysteine desulfurase/selenocysteine lyase
VRESVGKSSTSPSLDVERLRAETPGVANRLHFNNAGSALMPSKVLETAVNYLKLEAEIGGYEAEEVKHSEMEGFYDSVARLLNCDSEEIAYAENATRAWDIAFYSLPLKSGDKILTSASEYASNYIAFLQAQKIKNVQIEVVPNDKFGQIDLDALESMIDSSVRLVALTHVPTNGGLVNPVQAVGALARRHDIMFLLDACQSVGQMKVDVKEIGCDFLSATGRKFLRGPRGTGFLYVRKERLAEIEPIFLDLHAATWTGKEQYEIRDDARRFENWEQNYAGKLGLAAAIDYATNLGMENIQNRIVELAIRLRHELATVDGVTVTDLGETKCGIVTFFHDEFDSKVLVERLNTYAINISSSSLYSTRLDMEARGLPALARASVHYYNTEAEVIRFCECLREL